MASFVKEIKAWGIHNRFDIHHKFQPGINIIYGRNGVGKTTLLHLLANILNADYRRFFYLDFHSVRVEMNDGNFIQINKETNSLYIIRSNQRRVLNLSQTEDNSVDEVRSLTSSINKFGLSATYFPAFRTMLEAWASLEQKSRLKYLDKEIKNEDFERSIDAQITTFARELFGQFVPWLDYPYPNKIKQQISASLQHALLAVANIDREVLSKSLVGVVEAFLPLESSQFEEEPKEILNQIKALSSKINSHPLQVGSLLTKDVYLNLQKTLESLKVENKNLKQMVIHSLNVYRDIFTIISETQESQFSVIENYLESVNSFFENKRIEINVTKELNDPIILIRFDNEEVIDGFHTLSSGERQIITLIYAAHMSKQSVILIDEPEISLNVDWQRNLLDKMSSQLHGRQIITCTHSPMIAADYEDLLTELVLTQTDDTLWERQGFPVNLISNDIEVFNTDDSDEHDNSSNDSRDFYDGTDEFNVVNEEIEQV